MHCKSLGDTCTSFEVPGNNNKSHNIIIPFVWPYIIQSVSAIAYPFDFRDFITITDASLYAIRSIFFDRHMKGKEILPAWRFDK